jgi:hypothetical protein
VVWVNSKNWEKSYIPWEMDESWVPVVNEFIKTGKYKPEMRKKV